MLHRQQQECLNILLVPLQLVSAEDNLINTIIDNMMIIIIIGGAFAIGTALGM